MKKYKALLVSVFLILSLPFSLAVQAQSTLKGDASLDGKLDNDDVQLVIQHILYPNKKLTGQALTNANFSTSTDGGVVKVNVGDLMAIINQIRWNGWYGSDPEDPGTGGDPGTGDEDDDTIGGGSGGGPGEAEARPREDNN